MTKHYLLADAAGEIYALRHISGQRPGITIALHHSEVPDNPLDIDWYSYEYDYDEDLDYVHTYKVIYSAWE